MSTPTAIAPLTINALARDLTSRAGQPVPALRLYESLTALWIRCRDTGRPGEPLLREAACRAAGLLASGDDFLVAPAVGWLPRWTRWDQSIVRLPASLAVQGVEWQDMTALAQAWLDARRDAGPVLVAGVRTGGAYLAPLVAAHLEAAGVDVQVTSVRPGEQYRTDGQRRVLLVDDPPLTGRTLLALAREMEAEVLVPVFDTGDVQPLRQAGVAVTVLPRALWQSTRRLDPDTLDAYLRAHAHRPGAYRPPVLDSVAPGRENSARAPWPGVRRRSPARAAVRLRTPDGIRHGVTGWVPPGIFGDAARAAVAALHGTLVPATLAVTPALVVSEDLTPVTAPGPRPGAEQLDEAVDYVLTRAGRLPVQPAELDGPVPTVLLAVARALTGTTDGTRTARLLHDLLSVLPAALPDNRCEPEKWHLDRDGRLRKTGHLAHAYRRDNELLTPLIDLAALTVAFGSTLDAVAAALARRLPGEQPWAAALAVALLGYGMARGEQIPRTYNAQRAIETAREAYRLQHGMSGAAALLQRTLDTRPSGPQAVPTVVHRWERPPAALVQPRLPVGGTPAEGEPGMIGEEPALTLEVVERWARGRFQPVREADVLLLAPLGGPEAWPRAHAALWELPDLLPRPGLLAWCGVPMVSLGEAR
ncbi:hypothetical protein ACIQOV_00115 [Kitasatospora sp. NPDC091257]|uniref:hypothetical protein n=1 Tax=Kitasatospora sp. NPDC091257 TaxID=3364084 RepID=UPI00380F918B